MELYIYSPIRLHGVMFNLSLPFYPKFHILKEKIKGAYEITLLLSLCLCVSPSSLVFSVIRVVSRESRRLVLHRTSLIKVAVSAPSYITSNDRMIDER
jgi:hypothetical protein